MASINETVTKTITVRGKADGIDELTGKLKTLAGAHADVAVVSEDSARRQTSAETQYKKQGLAIDEVARANARVAKEVKVAQAAFNHGILGDTQSAAAKAALAARIADITAKYGAGAQAAQRYAAATNEVRAIAMAAAGGLGSFGGILSAIGPGGLAVGAALGVAALGIKGMSDAAHDLAERSGKMVDFAETVGLSTDKIQALNRAGAEVGISSDKIASSFEKFSVGIDEAREGSGKLFKELGRVNPELALQMASAHNAAAAWDILAKAVNNAATAEQRITLARAAFGRGGGDMVRLLGASSAAGGLDSLTAAQSQISMPTRADMARWDELVDKIKITSQMARDNITSIFAKNTLVIEKRMADTFLEFSESAKQFSLSGDLRYLLEMLTKVRIGGKGTLLGDLGIDYDASYKKSDTFADRFDAAPGASGSSSYDEGGMVAAYGEKATALARVKLMLETQSTAQMERQAQATLNLVAAYGGSSLETAPRLQQRQERDGIVGNSKVEPSKKERVADVGDQRHQAA